MGSCNENCIYIFKYDSTASNTVDAWPLVNKIQGFKSGDTAIGYRIACNFNKNIFATSSNGSFSKIELSSLIYLKNSGSITKNHHLSSLLLYLVFL